MQPACVLTEVSAVMRGPMIWGVSDCCTAAADVFHRLWGLHPMGPWRGAFRSRADAVAALRAADAGLKAVCFDQAAMAGLTLCEEHSGAIGLVRAVPSAPEGIDRVAAAICIRPGEWARRTSDGFAILGQPVLVMGLA